MPIISPSAAIFVVCVHHNVYVNFLQHAWIYELRDDVVNVGQTNTSHMDYWQYVLMTMYVRGLFHAYMCVL